MTRSDLTGCLVQIYRGRQKGIEGVVVHQDEHSLMITAPDLYGTENWYERTANVKVLQNAPSTTPPPQSAIPPQDSIFGPGGPRRHEAPVGCRPLRMPW